ncbi:MAG: hypothetical protein JOZ38_10610 [Candidatus Eremiobacteraeota bacterium]|nr:hypothetical protein [Candidatus Eremiobacteraeota bacterium]
MLPVTLLADLAPLRHVVYAFTVSIQSERTVHASGLSSGDPGSGQLPSGIATFNGAVSDRGTITVDVLQAAGDGGLVVRVSEDAREERTAKAADCAVYGERAQALCGSDQKVNDEELDLLQSIGRFFFQPERLDEKQHWRVDVTSGPYSDAADFSVQSRQGDVMQIGLERVGKAAGAQPYTNVSDGTITYDSALSIPTKIVEHTVTRSHVGMGQDDKVDTYVTLLLQADSMGARAP